MWKQDFLLVLLSSLIIIFVSFAFFGPRNRQPETVQATTQPSYEYMEYTPEQMNEMEYYENTY